VSSITLASDALFSNKGALAELAMLNAMAHKQFLMTARTLFGIDWTTYPLFDIGEPPGGWLEIHYQEHINIANALGADGPPDLASVDFSKKEQFYTWQLLHVAEHQKIQRVLGL